MKDFLIVTGFDNVDVTNKVKKLINEKWEIINTNSVINEGYPYFIVCLLFKGE